VQIKKLKLQDVMSEENEFLENLLKQAAYQASKPPLVLPESDRPKPPLPSLKEFDFKAYRKSWDWQENVQTIKKAADKLRERLTREQCDLPDRIDLRLTTDLCPRDSVVGLRLFVNRQEVRKDGVICPFELLRSTYRNERFYIHNCTCHSPECTGIWGGTMVADMGDWIFWETNDKEVNHVFLFDPVEYRREIFRACRRAVRTLKNNPKFILEMEQCDCAVLASCLAAARQRAQRRITCDRVLLFLITSLLKQHFSKPATSES
jgi:hypothetical protein